MIRHLAGSKRRRAAAAMDWSSGNRVWGEQEAWRVSTAHLQASYPARAAASYGSRGIYIGRDLSGGAAFVHDPWGFYNAKHADGANMLILGDLHYGKSGLIKRRVLRQSIRRDRRFEITDVKGEYGPLMEAVGGESLHVYRGGPTRLNPMRPAPDGTVADELMRGIATAALDRELNSRERAGLDAAVAIVSAAAMANRREPTVHELVKVLLDPPSTVVERVSGLNGAETRGELRDVATALLTLVNNGPMSGMFDGETTAELDWNAPAVRLDLSGVTDNMALGVLMVTWMAFLRQARDAREIECERLNIPVPKTERDNDEAWRPASVRGIAQAWVSEYKLSRGTGVAHLTAFHKLADISAGVADGTAEAKLLESLLADTGTVITFHQKPAVAAETARQLGWSETVARTIPALHQDQAIWAIGRRLSHVQHESTEYERTVTYTDGAMAESTERRQAAA